jgi:Flp pilus assembly protein TadD
VQLNLAIAAFHASGPVEGTGLLDRIPTSARGGEYYLAAAEMLDAAGRSKESAAALEQALRASAGKPGLYRRVCVFLLTSGRRQEAVRVSDEAVKSLPLNREVLLLHAAVLQNAGRNTDALRVAEQIQNRWPEWPAGWAIGGVIQGMEGHREEARSALRTALALGPDRPEVAAYLDEISRGAAGRPPDLIRLALTLAGQS